MIIAVLQTLAIVVLVLLLLQRHAPLAGPVGEISEQPADQTPAPAPLVGDLLESPSERLPVEELGPRGFDPGDPVGILLFGSVTDPEGAPVGGASIRLEAEGSGAGPLRLQSTAEGAYSRTGLGPGVWKVFCQAREYAALETEVKLDCRADRHRLDLVLTPEVVLAVRFVDEDGKRLQDSERLRKLNITNLTFYMTAIATSLPLEGYLEPTLSPTARPVGHGTWRSGPQLPGWTPGRTLDIDGELQLEKPLPVHVSALWRYLILCTQEVRPGTRAVDLVIPIAKWAGMAGLVRCQVVDALSGLPIPKAMVRISTVSGGGRVSTSDENGHVELTEILPGLWRFTVYVHPYETFVRVLRIEPGETLDLGVLQLHPALTISGRVGTDLVAKEGITLDWTRLDRPDPVLQAADPVRSSTRVQSDGTFTISSVGPGLYLVRARVSGKGMAWARVDTRGGPVSDLELTIVEGTPVEFVLGESSDSGTLILKDRDGLPLWTRDGYWARRAAASLHLPPGSYTLELYGKTGLVRAVPFGVGSAPVRVEFPP